MLTDKQLEEMVKESKTPCQGEIYYECGPREQLLVAVPELLRLRAALREILECESPRDMFETAKEALDGDAN